MELLNVWTEEPCVCCCLKSDIILIFLAPCQRQSWAEVLLFVCPSCSCECDMSGTPWGSCLKLDSRMKCLDFRRLKVTLTSQRKNYNKNMNSMGGFRRFIIQFDANWESYSAVIKNRVSMHWDAMKFCVSLTASYFQPPGVSDQSGMIRSCDSFTT